MTPGRLARVPRDVDVQVVCVPPDPQTPEGAFGEARSIFGQLDATYFGYEDTAAAADRAAAALRS